MKINELQQLSKTLINTADSFFRMRNNPEWGVRSNAIEKLKVKLCLLGWEEAGAGAYSLVFFHPKKKYVVKITNTVDEGYMEYVDLLKHHPNEHFPVISDMKSLKVEGFVYSIYLIEKLDKIDRKYVQNLFEWFYQIMRFPNSMLEDIFSLTEEIPQIFIDHPDLVDALHLLGRKVKSMDCICLDIHEENIMKRKDGTIVITDPYA